MNDALRDALARLESGSDCFTMLNVTALELRFLIASIDLAESCRIDVTKYQMESFEWKLHDAYRDSKTANEEV